jgi:hypothetical protein
MRVQDPLLGGSSTSTNTSLEGPGQTQEQGFETCQARGGQACATYGRWAMGGGGRWPMDGGHSVTMKVVEFLLA